MDWVVCVNGFEDEGAHEIQLSMGPNPFRNNSKRHESKSIWYDTKRNINHLFVAILYSLLSQVLFIYGWKSFLTLSAETGFGFAIVIFGKTVKG